MDLNLQLLKRLNDAGVDFVLVGGMAAVAHGSSLITKDVDVYTPLVEPNLSKIVEALRDLDPRYRFRPDKLRMPLEPERLHGFRMLNLVTELGAIDLMAEVSGVAPFEEIVAKSWTSDLGGVVVRIIDLESLISAKRSAGRPKDIRAVAELEAIRQRIREREGGGSSTDE